MGRRLTPEQKERRKLRNKLWEQNNKEYRTAYRKNHNKKMYEFNKEKIKDYSRKYNRENREKVKNSKLKRIHKISLEQYNDLLIKQNYVCAICKNKEVRIDSRLGKTSALSVDHCHVTGKIRGLLCFACNVAIGKFKDDISVLQNAIKYLEAYNGN